jgi:Zn-dependent M16 (insulinase) family peptidase
MPALVNESHFEVTQQFNCSYSQHKFTEYVSKRTGIRLVVVDQVGPKVQGFFAAATEILDDSGSPHTLEHLIFMGSKHYPYKGLLDKLATRAYSTTNAWTATDHTAYTLDSGGYAAFAQILPVYLDHLILPTLTDAACLTEVHHIDGAGHDAGVVYSEMQGVQNQGPELMDLRSKRLMYNENVGFRYETGGMMEQLRVLTADRIRRFHREMYQPKNLCLLIIGEVDHSDLLSTMSTLESNIVQNIATLDAPFKRPWIDSSQPQSLARSVREVVEFPEEDESVGEISIKYFGPHCQDIIHSTGLAILLGYLAGSSASVLENILVEKEQLTSGVMYYQTPRPLSVTEFTLTGVDSSQLQEVEERFLSLLEETSKNSLDMQYMKDCIARERRQEMFQAEQSEAFFTSSIISTFLFSETRDLRHLGSLEHFDQIALWDEQEWQSFMKKWLVDNQHITILGKPSEELAEKLKANEESRVAAQIKRLGENGLKDKRKELDDAKAQNDLPIPDSLLAKFKVPPPSTIHFISTKPAKAGVAKNAVASTDPIQQLVDRDPGNSPLFIHFEHTPSNFAAANVLLCTSTVPVALRPLLPIFVENFFNQPVRRNGSRLEFEDVVKELQRDTVDYEVAGGGGIGNSELLHIKIVVERHEYEKAIRWVNDLLWHGIFDSERIKSTIAKILADVPEEKRSGSDMAEAVSTMINNDASSNRRASGTLVKGIYLKKLKHLLDTEPNQVINQLERVRDALGMMSNIRVLVIADIEKLSKPVSSWDILTKNKDFSKPLAPFDDPLARFSEAGLSPGKRAYVVPISSSDSSFALSTAVGPTELKDPRNPALMVAIAYLDTVEGPMWTSVRGAGLAYHTSFRRRLGRLEFEIYSSPDASKAFSAAKAVLEDYVSGRRKIEPLALEGAISAIVLSLVNEEPTYASAALDKFVLEVVKDLPRDWNDIILEKVRAVRIEQILTAMKDMLLPLFSTDTSNLFVTIAPVMKEVGVPTA